MRTILTLVSTALAFATIAPAAGQGGRYLADPGTMTDRYLTAPEVRDVLHGVNDQFGDCFQVHLQAQEPGEITLTMTITSSGSPTEIDLEIGDGFGDLEECLLMVAEGLTFDEHDGDPLKIGYPIVFVRDANGQRSVPYPIVFVKPRERAFLLLNLPPALTPEERAILQKVLFP